MISLEWSLNISFLILSSLETPLLLGVFFVEMSVYIYTSTYYSINSHYSPNNFKQMITNIKIFFALLISVIFIQINSAQSKITFDSPTSDAQELYAQKGCVLHTVKLKIVDQVTIDATYKVNINPATVVSAEDYTLLTSHITIPKNQAANSFINIMFEIKSDTILAEGDESFTINLSPLANYDANIKIEPTTSHSIRIKNGVDKNKFNKDQKFGAEDFRLDLGSNFDLLDGLQGQGLYANVFTYAPDLVKISFPVKAEAKRDRTKAKGLKIGILSGIRRNRTFNDSTTVQSQRETTYAVIDTLAGQPNSFQYLRTEINMTNQTSFDNTSLHLSPIIRLYKNKKSTAFLALGYNLERRKRQTKLTFTAIETDTIVRPPGLRGSRIEPNREFNRTYYDHHYFIKTPMFFNVNKVNINIVPTIGFVNSQLATRASHYYGMSFNVIELKSGLTLGGEVLGFFGRESRAHPPFINFYLSKALNLDLFGRYKDGL